MFDKTEALSFENDPALEAYTPLKTEATKMQLLKVLATAFTATIIARCRYLCLS